MTAATASVVVCTYTEERWPDLCRAVASLRRQSRPPDEVILVVDHNPALAARAATAFEDVRVLANAHPPGLSGARTTGTVACASEVVAFLDDDAEADVDWLAHLLAPYPDPDVVAVGGAARPVWPAETTRPPVLPTAGGAAARGWGELDWVVGCSYAGQPVTLAEVRNVLGAGMSFRRSALGPGAGFTSGIGRCATAPLGCEETELCIRLRQTLPGARILFEPRAVVAHHVSPARTTWAYLRRRCWAEGLSKAAVSRLVGPGDALSTERRYVARVLPAAFLREVGRALAGRRGALTGAAAVVAALLWTSAGYLAGRARPASTTVAPPAAQAASPAQHGGPARARDAAWPTVSVVVPTVDRPQALLRCVRSVLATAYPKLEILVVDNRPANRPDPDPDPAARWGELTAIDPRIRYLPEPRPGASHARNSGLAAASGEYVAFLDDDIEVDPRWLHTLVRELAEDEIDCATSLVLPARLDTPPQRAFEALKGFGQGAQRLVFGPRTAAENPLYPFRPGRFGPGGAALWRAATVNRLGGFDPLLGPGTAARAGEDLHLFLRLARAGGSVVYTPAAVAWHHHAPDWPQVREQVRGYGTGLSAMLLLHVLHRPGDTAALVRAAVSALPGVLAPGRGDHATGAVPRALLLEQVRGLAAGPVALARSARERRRRDLAAAGVT